MPLSSPVDLRRAPLLGAPAVGVLPPSPPRDTPEVVGCRWGVAETWNSKVQGTQNFRQVQAAKSIISYVLCGGLYCLK
jgi:hypothetical protein